MTTTIDELLDLSHFQDSPLKWVLDRKLPDFTNVDLMAELFGSESVTTGLSVALSAMSAADQVTKDRMDELGLEAKPWDEVPVEQLRQYLQMSHDMIDEVLWQMDTILRVTRDDFEFDIDVDFEWPKPYNAEEVGGPEWTDPIGRIPGFSGLFRLLSSQGTQSGDPASEETVWVMHNIIWLTIFARTMSIQLEFNELLEGMIAEKSSHG